MRESFDWVPYLWPNHQMWKHPHSLKPVGLWPACTRVICCEMLEHETRRRIEWRKRSCLLTSVSSSRTLSMRYKSEHFVISKRTSSTDDFTVTCFCIKFRSKSGTDASRNIIKEKPKKKIWLLGVLLDLIPQEWLQEDDMLPTKYTYQTKTKAQTQ